MFPSTGGWGHCHGLCPESGTGVLWGSPGHSAAPWGRDSWRSSGWAVWSWFMLHSWASLGWDVLVLESGRKVHFGNYLFLLHMFHRMAAAQVQSAERSPCAALLQVKNGAFSGFVFSPVLLDGMHPRALLGQSFPSVGCAVTPQGLGIFFPLSFQERHFWSPLLIFSICSHQCGAEVRRKSSLLSEALLHKGFLKMR